MLNRRWVRALSCFRQSQGSERKTQEKDTERERTPHTQRLKTEKREGEIGEGGKYVTGCGFPELAEHQYTGIL